MKVLCLHQKIGIIFSVVLTATAFFFALRLDTFAQSATTSIPTTIRVSVCGDAVISDGENCDNGFARNNGQYSDTIAGSQCYPGCVDGVAPYCGDTILQPLYGETCDDGNNTSGDVCSLSCQQESPPGDDLPNSGGSSGSSGGFGARDGTVPLTNATRVILEGISYPNSSVNILQDGRKIGVVQTNLRNSFLYDTSDVTQGPVVFGFWAEDNTGIRSITQTATFYVVQGATTNVTGIYIPPTIEAKEKKVKQSETLNIYGTAIASSTILIYFNSDTNAGGTAQSGLDGKWQAGVSVSNLSNEKFHTVKVASEFVDTNGNKQKSGASQSVGFYVGIQDASETISSDVNGDGKVNIIDFSMMLFYWGTSEATVDFNRDGKVDLTDFSIMLFAWTG